MKIDLSDTNNALAVEIRKHLASPDMQTPELAGACAGGFLNGFLYALERTGPLNGKPVSEFPPWLVAITDRMHAEAGDVMKLR